MLRPISSIQCLPFFHNMALSSSMFIRQRFRAERPLPERMTEPADSEVLKGDLTLPNPRVPWTAGGQACCTFNARLSPGKLAKQGTQPFIWYLPGHWSSKQLDLVLGKAWLLTAGSRDMGKRSHSSQVTDVEATESWNDKNTHVRVTQPEGFMCQVCVVPAGLWVQAGS